MINLHCIFTKRAKKTCGLFLYNYRQVQLCYSSGKLSTASRDQNSELGTNKRLFFLPFLYLDNLWLDRLAKQAKVLPKRGRTKRNIFK